MSDLGDETLGPIPTCPKCGYKYRDAWDWNMGDEDTREFECECGAELRVICRVSVDYLCERRKA